VVAGEPLRRVDAPTPLLSARHLSQRSKVIATTSSGKSADEVRERLLPFEVSQRRFS